jgi:phosphate transport system permease protein
MSPKATQKLAMVFVWGGGIVTVLILLSIIGYIFIQGIGDINIEFLTTAPRGGMEGEGGISTAIVGTLYLVALAIIILIPPGVGAAIYLAEYARDNWVTRVLRYGVETLAGVPSIVFGLFGYLVFVTYLRSVTGGYSLLAGALTIVCLLLPTIIRTSEEAIKAVPRGHREAALALGATKWQSIRHVLLPAALPGIVTGIILCIGRVIEETACLYVTMGSAGLHMPSGLQSPATTLSLQLFKLAMETRAFEKAMATGVVLVVTVIAINMLTNWLSRRFQAKLRGKTG